MTPNEIHKLRRQAFLALKAYFSLSLSQGWEDTLESRQMQAAYFMHQAACLDLSTQDATEMSPRVRAIVLDVVETMEECLGDGSMENTTLVRCHSQLRQALGELVEQDNDQGGAANGGPHV